MDSETEIWIQAKGFEGWYEVSNFGRIKRLPRLSKNSRNDSYKKYNEKILSTKNSTNGRYLNVKLTVNGITKTIQVHRLILESFIPNLENKKEVNHKDGNKKNNKLENLEWVTSSENKIHAIKNNLIKYAFGEKVSKAKLNNNTVKEIKKYLKNKSMLQKDIARKFGITEKMVTDINTGRTWSKIQ